MHVDMSSFIQGRMEQIEVDGAKQTPDDTPATPLQHAEFRSAVGCLHWVASQCRMDVAYDINVLQKRQCNPTAGDLRRANKVMREVQKTPEVALRIIPIPVEDMVVVTWTDASLYGNEGEIEDDLHEFDPHKVRSQMGCLVGMCNKNEMTQTDVCRVSILDWSSRSLKRVVSSTFAGEASAATAGFGYGEYLRVLWACMLHQGLAPEEVNNDHVPMVQITDCKSLYDHVKADGKVPEDKKTAILTAGFKSLVSAGAERDEEKVELRWVASRWQMADALTKDGLSGQAREFMTSCHTKFHELSAQALKRENIEGKKIESSVDIASATLP
mmetsp:Transcript_18011/g.41724  ORF Transcript_18011/g.41724 Transcript_18011/m.41724 type:complete len:328 (+) Transcript_18011:687-1670(+)